MNKEKINLEEKQIKKMQKCLNKIFKLREIGADYEDEKFKEIPEDDHLFMDCSNVCGIGFKDMGLKDWFYRTFEVYTSKIPELNYLTKTGNSGKCGYSINFLFPFIELCKILEINPIISIKEDYPITIEVEELFKVIIAPRVES